MQLVFLLILIITGILIFFQDINTRTVSWPLFLVLAINGFLYSRSFGFSDTTILTNAFFNFGLLFLQFMLLHLYFWVKEKKAVKLINKKIGLGDIFFMLSTVFYFAPISFILFYSTSLFFALFFHFVYYLIVNRADKKIRTIPLAGIQSIYLILCILLSTFFHYNSYTTPAFLIPDSFYE